MRVILIADYKDTLEKLDAQFCWIRNLHTDWHPEGIQGPIRFFQNEKTAHFLDWRWGVLLQNVVPYQRSNEEVKRLLMVDARESPEGSEVALCSFAQEPGLEDLVNEIVKILLREIKPRLTIHADSVGIEPRYQPVLDNLLQGFDNKKIAEILGISKHSVSTYVCAIKKRISWLKERMN